MDQKENTSGTFKFGLTTSKTLRRMNLESVKKGGASNVNSRTTTFKNKLVANDARNEVIASKEYSVAG